ncbi:unnamed protein product [Brachionus calyciflorus]|uniref:HAT C-terminal dimerisation domain-containing protein n=1 Tax=Brachionus calyciflorus TaxID=104777 RepID=A0A814NM89_9BILA|nr:unnamed protein product [Brachionus calyciflorus]
MFDKIKNSLKGKKVAILCDESTDTNQRYFLQVLCKDLSFNKHSPVLLDTVYLEEVNFRTVSQAVIKTLNKYDINFDNVFSFVSDNASYMFKSYNNVLINLLPNSHHTTCVAHIIALIADTWRISLKKLDKLVGLIKFIFSKSPARRIRYKVFLQELNVEKANLPPEPVITRWNTWFTAIQYHVENWDHLCKFINSEISLYPETESLSEALEILKDLRVKNEYQGNNFLATELYNDLNKLHCWHLANFETFKNDSSRLTLFQKSHEKLKKYLFDGAMPSMKLFKEARFLDPEQFKNLDQNFDNYARSIPNLKNCRTEWLLYLDILKETSFENSFNIIEFWLTNRKKIPSLFGIAEWLLFYPTNSADCERSISIYNKILTDDRNRLTKESIVNLNFIVFNNQKIQNVSLEKEDVLIENEIIA